MSPFGAALSYDLHSHTTFSDGRSALDLCVRAAECAGLEALAITDHMFEPGRLRAGATLEAYLLAIEAAQRCSSVRLLRGVETTALDADGVAGIDDATAARLDIVLCDLGGMTRGVFSDAPVREADFLDALRRCMVGVCADPRVHVLAHPFNVGRLKRGLAPDSLPTALVDEVCAAAAAHHTAFEVINDVPWWFPEVPVDRVTHAYAGIVARAVEHGCRISVGSDAHSHQGIGNMRWIGRVLALAAVPPERLLDWRHYVGPPA